MTFHFFWSDLMKKTILFVLLLLFIPLAQAIPDVTSYWGSVTYDGITQKNASITVIDSSGKTVATATSNSNSQYAVDVYWDKLSTQTGVYLTFQVNGKTAITRTIDPKGESIRLDLAAKSSSGSSSGGGGGGSSGGTYPSGYTSTGTAIATATAVKTSTATAIATPVVEKTEVPTTTAKPEVTKTTKETPKATTAQETPGFGAIIAILAIGMLASLLKNNKSRR